MVVTSALSLTVKHFPEVFRSTNRNVKIVKCTRWYKRKDQILASYVKGNLSVSHKFLGARKRVENKAGPGRGRKRKEWMDWLYPLVRADFDRLKANGLKFSPRVLQLVAKGALHSNPHEQFGPNATPDNDPRPLIERITPRWVQ